MPSTFKIPCLIFISIKKVFLALKYPPLLHSSVLMSSIYINYSVYYTQASIGVFIIFMLRYAHSLSQLCVVPFGILMLHIHYILASKHFQIFTSSCLIFALLLYLYAEVFTTFDPVLTLLHSSTLHIHI